MWPQIARTLCPRRSDLLCPEISSGCQLGSQESHRAALTARPASLGDRSGTEDGGMRLSSLIVISHPPSHNHSLLLPFNTSARWHCLYAPPEFPPPDLCLLVLPSGIPSFYPPPCLHLANYLYPSNLGPPLCLPYQITCGFRGCEIWNGV